MAARRQPAQDPGSCSAQHLVGEIRLAYRMVALGVLTGLDAQFVALETPRQSGHFSGLTILDPVRGRTVGSSSPMCGA